MEKNNIKVHPPWYARGTPVTNPRDGPAEAIGALPPFAFRERPSARGKPPDNMWPWLTLKIFNTVNLVDTDRACPDPSGSNDAVRSGERSDVAAVHFDLSACAAPDNVKMGDKQRSAVDVDAVKSKDVDRSEERSEVAAAHFDLSACAAPDNVKMGDKQRSAVDVDAVKSKDADRSEERSEVAAVHFDLSAYAVPDNVKMVMDNVKMVEEERSEIVDADRACPDPSGSNDAVRSGERSDVAAVHFDLSAYAVPDNVKMVMDNVKMVEEERSEIVDADRACPDPSGSNDAVRSEERSEVAAVHFDLSACAVPDNVKMVMDNVKMLDDDTIDIYILKRTKIK